MVPQVEIKTKVVKAYPQHASYKKFEMEGKGWTFKREKKNGKKIELTSERQIVSVVDDRGRIHRMEV